MGRITKKFKLQDKESTPQKYPCKKCSLETNHDVVSCYVENGSDDYGNHSVDWIIRNITIQCLGCEEVSFMVSSTNSEDYEPDEETGGFYYYPTITYYPGRVIGSKVIDHWLLPAGIGQIYKEARSAVENELLIIAGIAIRALLESICSDVKAKGRTLDKKIDDLHAQSLVTKEGVETLHKIRILGNRAAHDGKAHSKDQLLLASEVIEHILIGTYIIPERAKGTFKNFVVTKSLAAPAP